jgi:hypothetical protein
MALYKTGQWKLWMKLMTSKRFQFKLQTNVRSAMHANVQLGRGAVIKGIDSGAFAANSPFTVKMKGSSKPLVDKGDLRRSIQGKVLSWREGFIGVLRTGGGANVAELLHEGGTLKVTPKMRRWFGAQANAKGTRPLSPGTTSIRIPGRPFIKDALDKSVFQIVVIDNFNRAVEGALHDTVPSFTHGI